MAAQAYSKGIFHSGTYISRSAGTASARPVKACYAAKPDSHMERPDGVEKAYPTVA